MTRDDPFELLLRAATELEAIAAALVARLDGPERERGEARLRAATELVVRANAAKAEVLIVNRTEGAA